MVSGRVLDPGTALAVKGVRPRSTVYVGPRLIVSRHPGRRRGDRAAAGGGRDAWAGRPTVHPDDVEELRRAARTRTRSPAWSGST